MLLRTYASATLAFVLFTFAATDAVATAQRTFVASVGNDANPCSLTSPCRTFGAAVTQTNPGGEVIVLDSAGYGPVTINQSVSIISPAGIYAGISVPPSGNATGVDIDGAGINVVLRGLTVNGVGGSYGIRMTNGSQLTVEDCVISKFKATGARGVSIETSAAVKVTGTVVRDNASGITVGFGAKANIANSQVTDSGIEGIQISGGSSGDTKVFIDDTLVSRGGYCIDNYASSGTTGYISATRVTVTGCSFAISNEPLAGATGTTTVSSSTVVGNDYGLYNSGGTFDSLGNNHVDGNINPSLGTITIIGGM